MLLRVVVIDQTGSVIANTPGWAFASSQTIYYAPEKCADTIPAAQFVGRWHSWRGRLLWLEHHEKGAFTQDASEALKMELSKSDSHLGCGTFAFPFAATNPLGHWFVAQQTASFSLQSSRLPPDAMQLL